jgi:hypothetical protein
MHGRCKLRNMGMCNGERLTFGPSYENVQWNEFDSFAKPRPWLAPRTHPKPDLTYAFPIQTSTPDSLQGFAKDELTQTLSVQSLGKLVEQGVACAPTTALRNRANLPDRSGWSSSDRSCFPWAVVEIQKDVTSPRDVAVERCYCQAANAAAAALDIQSQLFEKLNDTLQLQSPPVVAFTCVGPVVKVWLAYNDKTIFGQPVQVRATHLYLFTEANTEKRMICIWSTSMRLTWGVASLRAIVKNMHTWSSRLLKPRLQVAISQASRCLPITIPSGLLRPPSQNLPVPVPKCQEDDPTSSSRVNTVISHMFGKPMTPEKHSTPAPHLRIDTPTPSKNTDHISPLRNRQSKETLGSRKDFIFGTNGLFGQLTSTGTDVFSRPNIGSSIGTATGVGFRNQSATKGFGLFGGTSTSTARESVQDASTSHTSIGHARVSLLGASQKVASPSSNTDNSKESSTSGSSTKLAMTSPGTTDPSVKSSTCRSSPKPGFGPSRRPMFGPSWKRDFGNKDNVNKSSVSGSSSKQAFSPSGKPRFENNDNIGKSLNLDLSPESASTYPPNPLSGLSNKHSHGCVGARTDNHGHRLFGASSSSESRTPGDVSENTSSAAIKGTNVFDITTAFASTSLEDVFYYKSSVGIGTTGTPFSPYREKTRGAGKEEYQTITFQPPYENYSLEELRVADYDRERRYPLPSYGFYRSTDDSETRDDHSDENADYDSDNDFDQDASDDSSDESSDEINEDSTETPTENPTAGSTDDSNANYSSDSSSGRSTHGALEIHGL